MNILAWSNDDYDELWATFSADLNDSRITTALLMGAEVITESSRDWPAFGEAGEEYGLYFNNMEDYNRWSEMFLIKPYIISNKPKEYEIVFA